MDVINWLSLLTKKPQKYRHSINYIFCDEVDNCAYSTDSYSLYVVKFIPVGLQYGFNSTQASKKAKKYFDTPVYPLGKAIEYKEKKGIEYQTSFSYMWSQVKACDDIVKIGYDKYSFYVISDGSENCLRNTANFNKQYLYNALRIFRDSYFTVTITNDCIRFENDLFCSLVMMIK